ncbi:flavodoxin domain-containing protein [Litoribacter populi]|uniref:flavodoxin domain-containing protein n=1 Tax=Litoribacter populi TaxID=2598460 RepID=UPI00163DB642|nr:flavodoxin domain-containing protein [Litoribacter populi]
MKTLILYQTKFGSAKQYAEWLQEDLGKGDLVAMKDIDTGKLQDYDRIVVCSSIYVGEVGGMKFLVDNWDQLKEKDVYLLVVGMSPSDSEESKASYLLIPEHVRNGLKGYYKIYGKIDFKKIGFVYKLMLRFKGIRESKDKMDREALRPLVAQLGEIRL